MPAYKTKTSRYAALQRDFEFFIAPHLRECGLKLVTKTTYWAPLYVFFKLFTSQESKWYAMYSSLAEKVSYGVWIELYRLWLRRQKLSLWLWIQNWTCNWLPDKYLQKKHKLVISALYQTVWWYCLVVIPLKWRILLRLPPIELGDKWS